MARPKIQISEEQVKKLAELQCTNVEIASFFNVDEGTIRKRFSDILAKGRECGKITLRRKQWALATKSPAIAIWLGKQYLGQTEKTELTLPDADKYFQQIADAISQSDTNAGGLLPRPASICN